MESGKATLVRKCAGKLRIDKGQWKVERLRDGTHENELHIEKQKMKSGKMKRERKSRILHIYIYVFLQMRNTTCPSLKKKNGEIMEILARIQRGNHPKLN